MSKELVGFAAHFKRLAEHRHLNEVVFIVLVNDGVRFDAQEDATCTSDDEWVIT